MGKGKPDFDRSGFDKILHEAIDHDQKPVEEVAPGPSYRLLQGHLKQHKLPMILVLVSLISLGWYGYSGGMHQKLMTEQEAQQQIQEVYGRDSLEIQGINEFITSSGLSKHEQIQLLNRAFTDDSDDATLFVRDYFYLFGDTLVYTQAQEQSESRR